MIEKQHLFKDDITQIASGFFEVKGLSKGDYDEQAVKYDKLISNGLYNRIMWGNSPTDYTNFCSKATANHKEGIIADIGCGTLSFASKVYAENSDKNIYLCDLSYEMLNIGKQRIESNGETFSNFTFLRSDAFNMPFKDNVIQTVFNFGILHVFDNPSDLIREMARILKLNGQLFLTSLCTDRKWSAKYLNLLHKKGHVAKPKSSMAIRTIIEENGISITNFYVKGGMVYITGIKKN